MHLRISKRLICSVAQEDDHMMEDEHYIPYSNAGQDPQFEWPDRTEPPHLRRSSSPSKLPMMSHRRSQTWVIPQNFSFQVWTTKSCNLQLESHPWHLSLPTCHSSNLEATDRYPHRYHPTRSSADRRLHSETLTDCPNPNPNWGDVAAWEACIWAGLSRPPSRLKYNQNRFYIN